MADLKKTVEIIFGAQDRDVSRTLAGMSSQFSTLSSMSQSITDPLAKAADSVIMVNAALAALAVGGLTLAYNKAVEFETAMVGFKKVSDGLPETLATARKAAFELGTEYGVSTSKVLASTTDFIQAGFNTKESILLTKAAMDLKIAGDMDAAKASEYLIATLKGFNAPASESTRLIDVLNEVSNKYATNVEELAKGMSGLAPIAKIMGFSFEETAGLLTPVIEVFRSGDEAAIALKTGLLKLVDDTKSVQEALKSIGVAQKDANGHLRSGKDILYDVATAFKALDQNQKLFVTQQLVGIDQSARMVTVFDNLGKVSEITKVGLESAGSAAKEVAARLESSQAQIDRFKVGFENLGIIVGEKFKESATAAVKGSNDIMTALSGMVSGGAFDPFFNLLTDFGQKLNVYLSAIAKNLPAAWEKVDLSGLLAAITDLGGAFANLFGDMDLTTVDGLAAAIQSVVDVVTGFIDVTNGMVVAFKPFLASIFEFFAGIGRGDEETAKTVGQILALAKAVEVAGVALVGAILTMNEFSVSIGGAFNVVAGGAQILWNGLQLVADAVQGAFIAMEKVIFNTINSLTGGLFGLTDTGKKMAATIAESESILADSIIKNVGDAGRGLDKMVDGFNNLGKSAQNAASDAGQVKTAISDIPDKKTSLIDADTTAAIAAIGKAAVEASKVGNIEVKVEAKAQPVQYEQVWKTIKQVLPDGTTTIASVLVDVPKLTAAGDAVKKAVPDTKKTEVQLETEKLKQQSAIVQKAIEWKAKVDMAGIEADITRIKTAFASIDNSVKSTGDVLTNLGGSLNGLKGTIEGNAVLSLMKKEMELRQQTFDLQKRLTEEQLKTLAAKREAIRRGDSMITVKADGLKPHLEAFMWAILEAIQVRANESGAEFLLGV